MTFREIVSVHIGQAGCQIADAAWELFCVEHGVQANGRRDELNFDPASFHTFFQETPGVIGDIPNVYRRGREGIACTMLPKMLWMRFL